MVADNVEQTLTINGRDFSSNNVVQFRYGVGPGSGVWTTSSRSPTITATRITIPTNPGTVADTINWRVCRSAAATATADCSSGTHAVTVTPPVAAAPAPSVSSISPTSMVANNVEQTLTINGRDFSSNNVVQFRYGVGPGSGVWTTSSRSPTITATRITIPTNPGTVADTINWRVCRSAAATATADCSSGTHAVTVTPPVAAAPAPSVSSISPTSMVANNVEQTLTINGRDFSSNNVVQFRYGVGPGSGVWTTSSRSPTITATRITIPTNPGTVADTINWRVCRSAAATATADCSSGTHAVTVTPPVAAAPAPSVSSISPTSMVANNVEQTLTINGRDFSSNNVVQFRYGVGPGSGVWTTSSRSPTITATRITIPTNPGTVADTINWRVCRSAAATATADCSSGTHAVTVTPPVAAAPAPSVSSISPTSMVANNVEQTLTINGRDFSSNNVVQFRYGVGPGSGVWTTSSRSPTITATRITIPTNPGTVADTINWRVCRSAAATATADCSSGTHAVTVTPPVAAAPAPSVSSISPTSMVANNSEQTLTINGRDFSSNNVVQFRYGVGPGSGVWTTSSRSPTITATRITIPTNPGTVADTINWRVCRSAAATATADCSSGTHAVTVTPPVAAAPAPSVSSISPTSMVANNVEQTLTINGRDFSSNNVVQFRYGVGPGSGVWTTSSRSPTITATRITIPTNPGTVADTINWRVCRSAAATATADCSSGTHAVVVR